MKKPRQSTSKRDVSNSRLFEEAIDNLERVIVDLKMEHLSPEEMSLLLFGRDRLIIISQALIRLASSSNIKYQHTVDCRKNSLKVVKKSRK